MNRNLLTLSILSSLVLAPAAVSAAPIVAKQLAGPPSEFEAMREVDPTSAAIHSKAALLPLEFSAAKAGGFAAQTRIPVEGEQTRFLVIGGNDNAKSWSMNLRDSKGKKASLGRGQVEPIDTLLGMGNANHAVKYFSVNSEQANAFTLNLGASAKAKPTGFVLVEGDAETQLYSAQTKAKQFPGERLGFVTSLFDAGMDEAKAGGTSRLGSAHLRVTEPNATSAKVFPMFDDGAHNDGVANDGIFGGDFLASAKGQYVVQVVASGVNARGQAVTRTAEHLVPVVEQSLSLTGQWASGTMQDDRFQLAMDVSSQKANHGHVRAYAEVWGTNAMGQSIPVAWVGGMTTPENGKLKLGLDPRWVTLAGAQAPFEFRNVRVEDPDFYVTLSKADRMSLALPEFTAKARASDIVIDEAMTMGKRPAELTSQAKGVGTRLLLVHGYCSSDVWPASHFTNASKFLDLNQNRSNDQFARLIQSFGATWNSFGIVAHSQGGMAATHLYNYYWSGLDNATGSRLIQSVGTPYKGTNLAGVLAALGSLFGVGCSSNTDLTYSGASSWGAGISTATRNKVNYYTTSFKIGAWYVNDYCNFASDLVLSDPEDGTTEQTYGQFTSAINRGHVTGQCHTAGMRDPAQYQNSTRNATMNTNAAR